jgi:anti-sigma regulatory factor (Ser/Thr protein kinase)
MTAQEDGSGLGERARLLQAGALHHTDVPATADWLFPLRLELRAWAASVGVVGDLASSVILAVDEAMSNVLGHAYAGTNPGTFDLHATVDADRNSIHVIVADRGRWQAEDSESGTLGGRGLILIRMLANETEIERVDTGTTVRMTWVLA